MTPDWDNSALARVLSILTRNKDKDFVQRIFNPQQSIPVPGGKMTHLMGYDTDDSGSGYVYPNVINAKVPPYKQYPSGLSWLSGLNASQHAQRNKEYIKLPAQEADSLAANGYKRVWGLPTALSAMFKAY